MAVAPYIGAAAVLLAALVVYIAPIVGEMRRLRAEAALRRVAQAPGLSPDVSDIVGRSLAPAR